AAGAVAEGGGLGPGCRRAWGALGDDCVDQRLVVVLCRWWRWGWGGPGGRRGLLAGAGLLGGLRRPLACALTLLPLPLAFLLRQLLLLALLFAVGAALRSEEHTSE